MQIPRIHSPKSELRARLPSPLTLPPSQFYKSEEKGDGVGVETKIPDVVEQKKTVLVLESPKVTTMPFFKAFNGTTQDDTAIPKDASKGNKKVKSSGVKKKVSSAESTDEDVGMRIITIAGDNKGAVMEMGSWATKHHHYHQGNVEEGKGKSSQKNHENEKGMIEMPVKAFMNSNVQGVNNSLLYETFCSHNDPGVHLSLTRNRKPGKYGFGSGFRHHGNDPGHHTC